MFYDTFEWRYSPNLLLLDLADRNDARDDVCPPSRGEGQN